MSILTQRVIAVTGAGSGIGRALALALAGRGAKLALADRDEAGLADTARMLGDRIYATRTFDVTDHAALQRWIDDAAAEHGRLDGIVNNAGLSVVAPFANCPAEDFDRVMAVNFGAVVAGCRFALPHLRRSDRAWLVNISSVFGMMGYPTQSAYNASKFAVRGLTEALHIELARTDPHIRVIRVHPGGIRTNVARSAKFIRDMSGATERPAMALSDFDKAARTTPERAAEVIVAGMEAGRHRILIGPDARLFDLVVRLFPASYFRRLTPLMQRKS